MNDSETSIRAKGAMICSAIEKRKLLRFLYDGKERVVAPYCHGISTKGGEVLRAVQLRGASSSGTTGFGKLWSVTKVTDLRVLDENFVPNDPNYNPNDRGMTQIHCRI
ncbi:MAG: hypothetical protein ABW110_00960 [Steroidobacteraceae bacterium]